MSAPTRTVCVGVAHVLLMVAAACDLDNRLVGRSQNGPSSGEVVDSGGTGSGEDTARTACAEVVLEPAGDTPVSAECEGTATPVADPWAVSVKWRVAALDDGRVFASMSAPVVGRLTEDDAPDVVISATDAWQSEGWVVAFDGATGRQLWLWEGAGVNTGVAVADADGDGRPDVLAFDKESRPVLLDETGALVWRADDGAAYLPLVTVADLDGDGAPEVIAEDQVLDGATGVRLFGLDVSGWAYKGATAGDLDLDGDQAVYLGSRAWDDGGDLLWDARGEGDMAWPVLLQADADAEGEIGFLAEAWTVLDADGSVVVEAPLHRGASPGPPCVADMDGDGQPEIAFTDEVRLVAMELNGTPLWSVPITDASGGIPGCSAFDMDGDGAAEVLVADQDALVAYDGRTGTKRLVYGEHSSGTLAEYPVIADVDGDGYADILFTSQGDDAGLTVLEHAGGGWPLAPGAPWGTHDYNGSNLDADGGVPASPGLAWNTGSHLRALPPGSASFPDLAPVITDVCVETCASMVLAVSVENRGATASGAATLSVVDAADRSVVLATAELPEIAAGRRLAGISVAVPAVRDVVVRVGTTPADCDASNDEASVEVAPCP